MSEGNRDATDRHLKIKLKNTKPYPDLKPPTRGISFQYSTANNTLGKGIIFKQKMKICACAPKHCIST